jgi:hypothetical protein
LTKFESIHQTISVFEHAGTLAFRMLILKTDNPYPKTDSFGVAEPSNIAWDRGWQSAADAVAIRSFVKRTYVKPMPYVKRPARTGNHTRTGNHPRFVEARNGK